MRHTLSPAFTGSKLRGMLPLMETACRNLAAVLVSQNETDVRDVYRRFTADVIATTAFGTPSNALNDHKAEFYANGLSLLDFSGTRKLVVAGYILAPTIMRILRIPFLPQKLSQFFCSIICDNIALREERNLVCIHCK
jgi:cytochrome P450 family 9